MSSQAAATSRRGPILRSRTLVPPSGSSSRATVAGNFATSRAPAAHFDGSRGALRPLRPDRAGDLADRACARSRRRRRARSAPAPAPTPAAPDRRRVGLVSQTSSPAAIIDVMPSARAWWMRITSAGVAALHRHQVDPPERALVVEPLLEQAGGFASRPWPSTGSATSTSTTWLAMSNSGSSAQDGLGHRARREDDAAARLRLAMDARSDRFTQISAVSGPPERGPTIRTFRVWPLIASVSRRRICASSNESRSKGGTWNTTRSATRPTATSPSLTYDRPEQRNAVSREMNSELHHAWQRFRDDDEAFVLVITGAGDAVLRRLGPPGRRRAGEARLGRVPDERHEHARRVRLHAQGRRVQAGDRRGQRLGGRRRAGERAARRHPDRRRERGLRRARAALEHRRAATA